MLLYKKLFSKTILLLLLLCTTGAISSLAQGIEVSLPDTSLTMNDELLLPVHVTSLDEEGVYSYEFQFVQPVTVATPTEIHKAGTLSEDLNVNMRSHGDTLSVAASSATAIEGEGVLIYIRLKPQQTGTTEIMLEDFQFNEGSPGADINNAELTVTEGPLIQLDEKTILKGGDDTLDIRLQHLTNEVYGFHFKLNYDESVLRIDSVDNKNTLAANFTIEVNKKGEGVLDVAGSGSEAVEENGRFLSLNVTSLQEGGAEIKWEEFQFNEGRPGVTTLAERVEVAASAQVQLINTARGEAKFSYGDAQLASGLAYGEGTSYVPVPAGNELPLGVTEAESGESLINRNVELEADSRHQFIAATSGGDLELLQVSRDPETLVAPDSVTAYAVHALGSLEEATELHLAQEYNQDAEPFKTFSDDLLFGNATETVRFKGGTYSLILGNQARYEFDFSGLSNQVFTFLLAAEEAGGSTPMLYAIDSEGNSYSPVRFTPLDQNRTSTTPGQFKVVGNYPNPFNPDTRITYQVAAEQRVKVTLYNALGQKVAVLQDRNVPAGRHSIRFTAGSDLASGVYLYRVQAGEKSEIRKMTLLK